MKTIVFARHGLASEKGSHIDDRSRMTVAVGDAKTKKYTQALQIILPSVNAIISSGARRAKMTAEVIAGVLGFDRNAIVYDARLWTDDEQSIYDCIMECDDRWNTIIIVGHNDSLSKAANYFTRHAVGILKKSHMALVRFSSDTWTGVEKNTFLDATLIPGGHEK